MEEDVRHIDLIDRFLTGDLTEQEKDMVEKRMAEDVDFAREVNIYQQIYKGIAQKENADLKKRLQQYYEQYALERQSNQKRKNRLLYIGLSGVAASILVGAFLFFNQQKDLNNPIPDDGPPTLVDVDSLQTKSKDSILNPVDKDGLVQQEKSDSLNPDNIDNDTQLAFGNLKTLPSSSVRKVQYPLPLSYTFSDEMLTLYGDPLLSKLQLELIKNKENEYVLAYQKKYYPLVNTSAPKPLVELQKNGSFGNTFMNTRAEFRPSKEKLFIELASIAEISMISKDFIVRYDSESDAPTYFFTKSKGVPTWIIHSDLNPDKARVYEVSTEENGSFYFLVNGETIHALDSRAEEPLPLEPVDITKNKMARLFMENAFFETSVLLQN